MILAFFFLMGLIVGSFLNVLIERLPRGESIVRPRSHCPKCGKPIAWFDNVPLMSFFILKARCRHCREKISWRYPAVELISGLLWAGSWSASGNTPIFWVPVIFLTLLFAVSVTDLETGLIPDTMTFLGMGAGLLASLTHSDSPLESFLQSALGLFAGGGLIYLTGLAGNWIFQRESMGGGDVKLLAMIGSFLGWEKVLLVFFTAPFFALPFALYQRFAKKEEVIPYGPFLSLAGAVQFFCGDFFWKTFLGI